VYESAAGDAGHDTLLEMRPTTPGARRSKKRLLGVTLTAAMLTVLPLAPNAAHAASITSEVVKSGLAFPAGFTFDSSGRIFYGERFTGEIRIFNPTADTDTSFFTVPNVTTSGEQGLLGLALHPNYPTAPYVYASVTRMDGGVNRNEIVRITDNAGSGTGMKVLFTAGTAGGNHNGGRILFGPDNRIYLIVGEKGDPAKAQRLRNRGGKVLRLNANGAVPSNNPFSGKYVFAYGIRNSFGFAFDPSTDRLWESENGPACNDELNRIISGRNYGWGPSETCSTPPAPPRNTNQDGQNPVMPKRFYTPVIAPTGAAFCSGCRLGSGSAGRLFFGAWNTGEIRRVTLNTNRTGVASQSIVYTHGSGILSMERGPDGTLYFSDSSAIYKLKLA
jgi:aldose sugar dehydrogenase